MDSVEILKNTPLSAQENMRIVSEVLDPIVNTTNLIRFQLNLLLIMIAFFR